MGFNSYYNLSISDVPIEEALALRNKIGFVPMSKFRINMSKNRTEFLNIVKKISNLLYLQKQFMGFFSHYQTYLGGCS